jgi:molybdopterin-guanine dinucleotide biosynthesis protein A
VRGVSGRAGLRGARLTALVAGLGARGDRPVGLLLAGGAARRMGGQLKALLPFKGRPMASWGIAALSALCDRVVVSTAREGDLLEFGLSTVLDLHPGAGPLAGLQAGLRAAAGAPILALACDLPLIRAEDLAPLVEAAPGWDVVLYRQERGIEPLVAWYGPGALPAIDALLRGGGGGSASSSSAFGRATCPGRAGWSALRTSTHREILQRWRARGPKPSTSAGASMTLANQAYRPLCRSTPPGLDPGEASGSAWTSRRRSPSRSRPTVWRSPP